MPEWMAVALMFFAVPVAAIAGGAAVVAFIVWLIYKSRMARLEFEEKQKQMEMDQALMGLGGDDVQANIEIILDRLRSVEERLEAIEGEAAVQGVAGTSQRSQDAESTEQKRRDLRQGRAEQSENA